jgi:cobalt-zinc-cadmium efflux system outer membrane protein
MRYSSACAWRTCLFVIAFLGSSTCAIAADAPLTLEQAIAAALQKDPRLQTFSFRLRAADARVAQAALPPALEVSLDLENVAGSGETGGFDDAEATFALSQVIELGDKRESRIGLGQAGRGAMTIDRAAAQLDVLADVARRFITVAQRQQQLQLSREAVELAQHTVVASERRVNAAKSPHAELDRARIALDRALLEERGAGIELDTARSQLAATWGETEPVINGERIGDVAADLFTLPLPGDFPELAARLAGNPDLLRFTSEARLRDAELRLAASQRRPNLTVGVGLRHLEATNDQAFVLSASMPLFSARRASSLVAEAEANRELVDSEQRVARIRAQAMLYELHQHMTQATLVARTLKDDIQPRSAEALKETEYAYERGRYSYIELVDAQREYLSVRESLIEAAATAHTLRAEIERLTNAPLTAATP